MAATERTPLGSPTYARDWWIDVLIDSTWVAVRGIMSLQPPTVAVSADTARPLNEGWDVAVKTGAAWTSTLSVSRKTSKDAVPVYDVGQEYLRAAIADVWGSVHIRAYKMDGVYAEAYEGDALVDYQQQTGDPNALDTVQVTLTGQGELVPVTHPAVS